MPAIHAGRHAGAMRSSPYNRHPLHPLLVLGLALLLALVIGLFLFGTIAYAYRRIGIGEGAIFAIIVASLIGGAINIPIARLRSRAVVVVDEIVVFGVRYRVPVVRQATHTVLAVNLGGALIPATVSLLLLVRDDIWWQAAVAVAVVAAVVHMIARPVPGLGIAVPALVPPLLAAGIALALAPQRAAAVAYVAGSLGTLVGADLLNLHRLGEFGAGVASIGGAGTFDGIFLSGVMAVVLVGLS